MRRTILLLIARCLLVACAACAGNAPTEGVTAGKPAYPQALTRKFHFTPQPLAVYEREATIRLPLRVSANAPKGAQNLRVLVHVQACDEEKCFPPTTIETAIPVTIN